MGDFTGKVAVITGGCSGIGRACALRFAGRGARVAIIDYVDTHAAEVLGEINALTSGAYFARADVADAGAVSDAMQSIADTLGRIDFLVNCAGISTAMVALADYSIADWNRGIGINLNGTFHAMKYAIPVMLRNGGGAIVNLSSMMGQVAHPGGAAYVSSKHAVVGLGKAAALDYASQGIRVNTVGPGVIDTPMTQPALAIDAVRASMLAATPMGRFGQADEIAAVIVFLCSADASFITGAYYLVDGGIVLQ